MNFWKLISILAAALIGLATAGVMILSPGNSEGTAESVPAEPVQNGSKSFNF